MPIQGVAVATFNNSVPVTLHGEWNVDVEVPVFRAYGAGDGTPGSGYIGGALGTRQAVSGSFKFIVDVAGEIAKQTIQSGQYAFFTMDWPIGDPALGASKGKAIECHFDRLSFSTNNPEGQYTIMGTMSAGAVTGEAFQPPS